MTSLTFRNIRMALQSIRGTKLRSALTMLGIIIGVASVITAVSLGEGVRRQVAGNVAIADKNTISVRPGKLVNRAPSGRITSVNYSAALGSRGLTDQDIQAIAKLESVKTALPLSTISSLAKNNDDKTFEGTVIGTGPDFQRLSGQKVTYGEFFTKDQTDRDVAIIGKTVAEELFQENVPIGQTVILRGHDFTVVGIFDTFTANAISGGGDLNRGIFIPYQKAKAISSNSASIYEILVEPRSTLEQAGKDITSAMKSTHGDQEDFSVLTQAETLQLAGKTLTALTSFVAGIAAISLIVGGIGIMNIMFVSVTERTREIGVRKSLGATNRQIYSQFLIEASIVSLVGGIIGVLVALSANFMFTIFTNLRPAATLPIIAFATLSSVAVGIIFGTAPAIKAARKDPIQSLRYE